MILHQIQLQITNYKLLSPAIKKIRDGEVALRDVLKIKN